MSWGRSPNGAIAQLPISYPPSLPQCLACDRKSALDTQLLIPPWLPPARGFVWDVGATARQQPAPKGPTAAGAEP